MTSMKLVTVTYAKCVRAITRLVFPISDIGDLYEADDLHHSLKSIFLPFCYVLLQNLIFLLVSGPT